MTHHIQASREPRRSNASLKRVLPKPLEGENGGQVSKTSVESEGEMARCERFGGTCGPSRTCALRKRKIACSWWVGAAIMLAKTQGTKSLAAPTRTQYCAFVDSRNTTRRNKRRAATEKILPRLLVLHSCSVKRTLYAPPCRLKTATSPHPQPSLTTRRYHSPCVAHAIPRPNLDFAMLQ
jgi:hypothetical protein